MNDVFFLSRVGEVEYWCRKGKRGMENARGGFDAGLLQRKWMVGRRIEVYLNTWL